VELKVLTEQNVLEFAVIKVHFSKIIMLKLYREDFQLQRTWICLLPHWVHLITTTIFQQIQANKVNKFDSVDKVIYIEEAINKFVWWCTGWPKKVGTICLYAL